MTPRPSVPARSLLALVALAALTLAGCGSDDASPAEDPGTSGTAGSSGVTIEHKFGSTVVPDSPERVVSLGYTEQDALVLFGVEPIAVRYAFGPEDDVFFPWADEAAGDADPVILPREEINFEQIASLEPDLIMGITAGLSDVDYRTLSAIAPTVVQPAEYVDYGTPWQVQTTVTGEVFGQEEKAAEIVAEVEAEFAAAAAAHPELEGATLALSGPSYEGQYPFNSSDDTRTRFFTDLGLVVPAELDEIAGERFYGGLSREQASLLDTDVLVWQSGSDAERAEIEADPVLAALPVVREGRSLFIEGDDYAALQFTSALEPAVPARERRAEALGGAHERQLITTISSRVPERDRSPAVPRGARARWSTHPWPGSPPAARGHRGRRP